MKLIVGLGNPGDKYEETRHNTGFFVIDALSDKLNIKVRRKECFSLIGEKAEIILAKPQTFMNESGKAVKSIMKNQNSSSLIIIQDDIDLPIGKLKIAKERGSAGHKGIESIIKNVGNENLIRLRVGIQPKIGKPKDTEKLVIKDFTKEEQEIINQSISKIADTLDSFFKNGLERTQSQNWN